MTTVAGNRGGAGYVDDGDEERDERLYSDDSYHMPDRDDDRCLGNLFQNSPEIMMSYSFWQQKPNRPVERIEAAIIWAIIGAATVLMLVPAAYLIVAFIL